MEWEKKGKKKEIKVEKENLMRKILFLFFILVLSGSFTWGESNKFQLSILGGINNVFEYGSEDDYIMGENNFPVTPGHAPASIGMSFAYFFNDNIGVELDGRLYLSSKITLEDPSDKDTVEIDASKHYSMSLNLIYQLFKGSLRPYFLIGGGFDKLSAKDETYISEYGFDIEFYVPEKTVNPVILVGGGLQYSLGSSLGVRLDVRYMLLFDDPVNFSSLNIMAGVILKF